MTEPPQPPNQPPTPSGYGHLPGPPQPGYGFPPPGENPYAQQPPTVPQHAVAPPPMPPGAPQGAPGGPGGQRRQKTLIVIAASVATVLIAGTGAYFAFGQGDDGPKKPVAQASPSAADDKPSASPSVDKGDGSGNGSGDQTDFNAGRKPGEDKVLWYKSAKMDGPGLGIEAEGQWVAGDVVVKSIDKSLVAYNVTDGKQKWKLDFTHEICGMTNQTTGDGKTVLVVKDGEGSSADCNQLKLIDLKAGKESWTKEIVKENIFDGGFEAALAITGDTVVINRMGSASAYRISTGDKLFSSSTPEGCQPASYAAGNGKVIGIANCRDADETVEIQGIDPVTGKKSWTYPLGKGLHVKAVYSVDPLVLDAGTYSLASGDTEKKRGILSLTADGKKRASLAGEGSFEERCGIEGSDALQGCRNAVVEGDTLYLATTPDKTLTNEIVAFDLATGKAKWRVAGGEKKFLVPLKFANGQLVAYRKSASSDQGGEVISIPAAGGNPTVLLHNPSGPASKVESSFILPMLDYADGRLFMSVNRLIAEGKDEKLLMVFGK